MLNTTCPRCNAPYGRKLSVVYEEGLTSSNFSNNTFSETNAILKTKIKSQGFSTGMSQTELSKSAAPPYFVDNGVVSGSQGVNFFCAILALLFGIAIGFMFGDNFLTKIFFALVFGIVGGVIVAAFMESGPTPQDIANYNAKMEPMIKARNEWNETYICMSCANRFIPIISIPDSSIQS